MRKIGLGMCWNDLTAGEEFRTIGKLIAEVVDGLASSGPEGDERIEESVRSRVSALCKAFPVYPGM